MTQLFGSRKWQRGRRPAFIPSVARVSIDHTGREFRTLADMCAFWGVTPSRFRAHRKKGASLEEALTLPPYNHGKICRDHTGREFPSIAAMCREWGIGLSTYYDRVAAGVPLRNVLTAPVQGQGAKK